MVSSRVFRDSNQRPFENAQEQENRRAGWEDEEGSWSGGVGGEGWEGTESMVAGDEKSQREGEQAKFLLTRGKSDQV